MVKNDMVKMDHLFEQLLGKFVKFAEVQSDIRAAVVIGSRARVNCPADEWSDLDILVATTTLNVIFHPPIGWKT